MAHCTAKAKRTGQQCCAPAMANGKCRVHGGASLSGIASATYKTGRYSKNSPVRYQERIEASLADPELLSSRPDLALVDGRLEDLLARVDTGESGQTWRALQEAVHEFNDMERKATSTSNDDKRAAYLVDREEAMHTIIGLIQEGISDYAAWDEVKSCLLLRKTINETEQKRMVAMSQMVTVQQVNAMMLAVQQSIKSNVSDRTTLEKIARDLRTINLG